MSDQTSQMPRNIDYSESMNVGRVHESVKREKEIGDPGKEPVPLWALLLFVPWFVLAGVFVGEYYKGGGREMVPVYDSNLSSGARSTGVDTVEDAIKAGGKLYKNYCITCHQPTGGGVPGQYPSLVDSEWVKRSDKRLAMIIRNGLVGPITVKGSAFNNQMPAQGLTMGATANKKMAYIMTFLRQKWNGGASEVTPEQVSLVFEEFKDKKDQFTVADLEKVPADFMLEKVGSYGGDEGTAEDQVAPEPDAGAPVK